MEALTGSPVKVIIDSVSGGSVVVTETYAFLDNSATSAANLATVLTSSDSSSVFGTTFGPVTVAASSVKTGTVANPSSKHSCTWCDQADTHALLQICTAHMHRWSMSRVKSQQLTNFVHLRTSTVCSFRITCNQLSYK